MAKTVHYEGWQLACCGDPFKVGDRIEWCVGMSSVDESGIYGEYDGHVDYYENHHLSAEHTDKDKIEHLSGTVNSIKLLYNIYTEKNNVLYPGKSKLIPTDNTEIPHEDIGEYRYNGLIVEVANEIVRPLTDSEFVDLVK